MEKRKKEPPGLSYVPIERRVHERKAVTLPITFQVISALDPERQSNFRQATLRDISLGGLCFHTPEIIVDGIHISCDFDEHPVRENTLLIEITFPEPYGFIAVTAKAAWFRKDEVERKPNYAVGVRFLEFTGQSKETLTRFIRSLD